MPTYVWIIAQLVLTFGVVFYILRDDKKKAQPEERKVPDIDYDSLITILEVSAQRQIADTYQDFKIRDVRSLKNFEEEWGNITKKTMASLSPHFLKQLEFYHPRRHIIKMVNDIAKKFMIEYIRENKMKTM